MRGNAKGCNSSGDCNEGSGNPEKDLEALENQLKDDPLSSGQDIDDDVSDLTEDELPDTASVFAGGSADEDDEFSDEEESINLDANGFKLDNKGLGDDLDLEVKTSLTMTGLRANNPCWPS